MNRDKTTARLVSPHWAANRARDVQKRNLTELTRWSDCLSASMQRSLKPLNDRMAAAAQQFTAR